MSQIRKIVVCGLLFVVVLSIVVPLTTTAHAAKATHSPVGKTATRTGLAMGLPGGHGAQDTTPSITNLSVTGPGVAQRTAETTYVWPRSGYNFSMTLDLGGTDRDLLIEFCVGSAQASDANASSTDGATCQKLTTNGTGSGDFRLTNVNLTEGEQVVTVGFHDSETNRTTRQRTLSVMVIRPDGDLDGDSLTNAREVELDTALHLSDTDTDGLGDGAEINNYRTSPFSMDTDGDGLPDGEEISIGTNALVADTDGDGLDDGFERNDLSTDPRKFDTDDDGLDDGTEYEDSETDPTNPDTDGDGIADGREVEVYGTDPTRVDTDRDGLHDRTEIRLNTNPTNPVPVVGIGLGAAGAVVVAGYLVWRSTAVRRAVGTRLRALTESVEEAEEEKTGTADSTADGGTVAGDDAMAASVLTDEERVMELLRGSGGKLRQRELTERTEWSASKVSRLLSEMADDGRVEKIKLGRENVVVIDDEDVSSDDAD